MTQEEFDSFRTPAEMASLSLADLANKTPRTLLFGYTLNRSSFHTYIASDSGLITRMIYSPPVYEGDSTKIWSKITEPAWKTLSLLIPDKRLYPEACDLEFCRFLRARGFHLPFTVFNPDRGKQIFYGETAPARLPDLGNDTP